MRKANYEISRCFFFPKHLASFRKNALHTDPTHTVPNYRLSQTRVSCLPSQHRFKQKCRLGRQLEPLLGSSRAALTSLNLSHLPVNHLSSKKLPLSLRAEAPAISSAHTPTSTSICIEIDGAINTPHSYKHTDRKIPNKRCNNPVCVTFKRTM